MKVGNYCGWQATIMFSDVLHMFIDVKVVFSSNTTGMSANVRTERFRAAQGKKLELRRTE